jgi:hypothetical protein
MNGVTVFFETGLRDIESFGAGLLKDRSKLDREGVDSNTPMNTDESLGNTEGTAAGTSVQVEALVKVRVGVGVGPRARAICFVAAHVVAVLVVLAVLVVAVFCTAGDEAFASFR